jgi:hypothetical protein
MGPPKIVTVYTATDVATVDIRSIDLTADFVVWNRGGELRKISKAILQEAARLFLDGQRMVSAGRLPELPPEWTLIYWEACLPITTHRPVTVTEKL